LDIDAAGGEFIIGAGTVLKLAGGTLTGFGILTAGDGNGGKIEVPTSTTVPSLAIGGNGTVDVTAPAGTPASTPAPTLTVSGYLGWGDRTTPGKFSALIGKRRLARSRTARPSTGRSRMQATSPWPRSPS
jgi:hypothetical protein